MGLGRRLADSDELWDSWSWVPGSKDAGKISTYTYTHRGHKQKRMTEWKATRFTAGV
jgi:hypothetical protein